MSVLKRALALVLALGMVAMFFSACDRDITRVEEVAEPSNCFECHSDQNLALVAAEAQWRNSVHASGLNIDRGGSSSCAPCHTAEGFIQSATGQTVTGHDNPSPIHCFACHAPHSNADFRLRWTSTATLEDGESFDLGSGNLCVACHHSRRDVNTYISASEELSEHWGPHHSNQGDMLIGSNGYEYDWFNYEITTHRQATEDGCLDCHFNATGNSVVSGHSFNMRFVLRGEGGEEEEFLNTDSCEPCHGEIDDFNIGFTFPVQDSVDALIVELEALLEASGMYHAGHPVEDFVTSADSAGALWNFLMIEEDRSRGVHNSKYSLGLLQSAIMYLEGTFPPPAPVADRRTSGPSVRGSK